MVSNTTRLSALLFAHVLEEYVVFVEDRNLLDQRLPRYFPTFAIDVFFEHVCKMHVVWLLNRHTCSRNTANVLPRCTYFAHVFEKGAKFAAEGWLAGWLSWLAGWLPGGSIGELGWLSALWLLNRHTCSRNTANVLPRCTNSAHVFEKGDKFAGWLAWYFSACP